MSMFLMGHISKVGERRGIKIPTYPDVEVVVTSVNTTVEGDKPKTIAEAFCYFRFKYKGKWYKQEFAQEYHSVGEFNPEALTGALKNINREVYLCSILQKMNDNYLNIVLDNGRVLHGLDEDQRSEKDRLRDKYLTIKKNDKAN